MSNYVEQVWPKRTEDGQISRLFIFFNLLLKKGEALFLCLFLFIVEKLEACGFIRIST